jgi:hypothetical protein
MSPRPGGVDILPEQSPAGPVGDRKRFTQVVPPARSAHFDSKTPGRLAPALQPVHFPHVGYTSTSAGQTGAEGKGHQYELIAVADRTRLAHRKGMVIGHPLELGLGVTHLLSIAVTAPDRIDHPLAGKSVAHHPGWSCSKASGHDRRLPRPEHDRSTSGTRCFHQVGSRTKSRSTGPTRHAPDPR